MADNVTANAGSGGSTFAAPELSFSGDTTKLPIGSGGLLTGSEGAWTFTLLVGGAGAVSAGVQRMTLASDDPAVAALQIVDDWDESDRAKVNPIVGQAGVAGGSGTVSALTQRVVLATDVALPAGTNSIGKLAANSGVDIGDVDVTSIAAGDNNIGNVDIVTVPSDPFGANADAASATGSISAKLRFIASTGIPITGTVTVGSHNVTNAGTFAVQETTIAADNSSFSGGNGYVVMGLYEAAPSSLTAGRVGVIGLNSTRAVRAVIEAGTAGIGKLTSNAGVTIGAVEIAAAQTLDAVTTVGTVTTCTTLTGGGVAHDGADSGNPHKIGAKATTSLSAKTMVADNDRSDLFCGTDGVLIVRPNTNLEDVVQERTTNTDGASTAFASGLAAPGAGVRLWICKVTIANSSSSFCTVDLRDGAAGSVLWTLPVPATGGVVERFDPPLRLSANTALAFDASAATSTLSISANGFKSKV